VLETDIVIFVALLACRPDDWRPEIEPFEREQSTVRHLDKFFFVFEIEEAEVAEVGERLGDVGLDRRDARAEHHHAASHILVLGDQLVIVSRNRFDRRSWRWRWRRLACHGSHLTTSAWRIQKFLKGGRRKIMYQPRRHLSQTEKIHHDVPTVIVHLR